MKFINDISHSIEFQLLLMKSVSFIGFDSDDLINFQCEPAYLLSKLNVFPRNIHFKFLVNESFPKMLIIAFISSL